MKSNTMSKKSKILITKEHEKTTESKQYPSHKT